MLRRVIWGSLSIILILTVIGFVETHGFTGTLTWIEHAGKVVYSWVHNLGVAHIHGPVNQVKPS